MQGIRQRTDEEKQEISMLCLGDQFHGPQHATGHLTVSDDISFDGNHS